MNIVGFDKMKRNEDEKMFVHIRNINKKIMESTNKDAKKKKKKNRLLIIINVLGSAGPIRFLVNEDDVVSAVIATALKSYAREGRLPSLGLDASCCLLYCANAGSDALNPLEKIGCNGGRTFLLCKKKLEPMKREERRPEITSQKVIGWKAWINKSLLSRYHLTKAS